MDLIYAAGSHCRRRTLRPQIGILENGAFAVTSAKNGSEALAFLEKHDVDALLTDMIMPGIGGPDLIRELRRRYPSLPVCCMTGYIDNQNLSIPQDTLLIRKPFRPQELVDAVQRAIASPVQASAARSPGQLQSDVRKARDEWFASINQMSEIISEVPSGIPSPDGSARIELAGRERSAAFAKYQKALEGYRRALKEQGSAERGPEDRKFE